MFRVSTITPDLKRVVWIRLIFFLLSPTKLSNDLTKKLFYLYPKIFMHLLNTCVCVWVSALSHFSHVRLFVTPRTVTHQPPLSMGVSRQAYWSGFPCPSSEDPPDPGLKSLLPDLLHWQANSLPLALPGKPLLNTYFFLKKSICIPLCTTSWKVLKWINKVDTFQEVRNKLHLQRDKAARADLRGWRIYYKLLIGLTEKERFVAHWFMFQKA